MANFSDLVGLKSHLFEPSYGKRETAGAGVATTNVWQIQAEISKVEQL